MSLCYVIIVRRKHPDTLTKRLALLLSVGLAIIFAVAWVLLILSTSSGDPLSSGLEIAFLVIFTTLTGIHGVLIFLQWNAKPCFCPTKSNQEKPLEPSTLRRSVRHSINSRRPKSDLPEEFNTNVGWTFSTQAQQEYRGETQGETISLDSQSVRCTHSINSRRLRSDLPEEFNANVGWTFSTVGQQECMDGTQEETVSLDSSCVFDDEAPSTAASSADNIAEI